ncbi:uncharacterized protein A4U43_C01F19790 [Asparagus officinalis]|uniref:Uncharacterized protein n=1 Tax=Asparagus officinalis TaxID=4686 RepID=A0A5P1FRA8_ASPOF|nr:uncharacterized protein A4U43_C01F19790 [Asparagus officinalis]
MKGATDRTRCSVEMEPRTLNREDLHSAREEAKVIVQNNEPIEATNIFTTQDTRLAVNERTRLHEFVGIKESWKCSSTNSEELSINPTKLKEPLSSPF